MDVERILWQEKFRQSCNNGHPLIKHYEWRCPLCAALKTLKMEQTGQEYGQFDAGTGY